tara:strand:- start:675 stop:869 length:195 start_codon:yes stop_codon:yes gene_type:complete
VAVTPLFALLVANVPPLCSIGIVIGLVIFIASFLNTQIALYVIDASTPRQTRLLSNPIFVDPGT